MKKLFVFCTVRDGDAVNVNFGWFVAASEAEAIGQAMLNHQKAYDGEQPMLVRVQAMDIDALQQAIRGVTFKHHSSE
jgi:hypothetical protein